MQAKEHAKVYGTRYMCICFFAHIQHVPWFWHQFFLLIVGNGHAAILIRVLYDDWLVLLLTYSLSLGKGCHPETCWTSTPIPLCTWIWAATQRVEPGVMLLIFFQINRNQQLNFGNTPIAFSTTLALVVVQNICILHNPKPPLRWQRAFSKFFHISFLSKFVNLRLSLVFLCGDDSFVSKLSNLSISYLFISLCLYSVSKCSISSCSMHFWETMTATKWLKKGLLVLLPLPDALWVPLSMSSLKSWLLKAYDLVNWSFGTTNSTLPWCFQRVGLMVVGCWPWIFCCLMQIQDIYI